MASTVASTENSSTRSSRSSRREESSTLGSSRREGLDGATPEEKSRRSDNEIKKDEGDVKIDVAPKKHRRQPSDSTSFLEARTYSRSSMGTMGEENSIRVRLPSHTVPFTQQSSLSPFEMFMEQLLSMGYPYHQCETALTYVGCRSVEEAIDFLTMSPEDVHVDPHPFTPLDVEQKHKRRPPAPLALNPHQSSRSLTDSLDSDADHSEREEDEQSSSKDDGNTSSNTSGNNFPEDSRSHRHEVGSGGVAEKQSSDGKALVSRPEALDESGQWTICAICGLEEPFHVKMDVKQELFTLDNMEISSDPVIAQRQRRIQFEARMAKQRELLKAAEEKEEKLENNGEELAFCEICLEEKPKEEFYKGKCKHGFCVECLREHYRVKICDANILDLVCMHFGCDRKIKEAEILSHFKDDKKMLAKYEKFKRNAILARNKNCRWCPKPGCETPMIGNPRKPRLECPECKTVICFNCNQDWHPGKQCDELIDEKYSKWAKGKDIQLCPKCKARVWKNMGCNHMTCPSCHHNFCWLCRGTYRSENHFAPWNFLGCPGRQFAYESGSRPNILMRGAWQCGIFLLVIVLGVLALGVGTAALGVIIVAVVACCPCITVIQCKRMRDERRSERENIPVPRRLSRHSSDQNIGPPLGVPPRFGRREFESFHAANDRLNNNLDDRIRNVEGVLHIMTEDGNLIDFGTHERKTLIDTISAMGYHKEHIEQAIEKVGCSIEPVLDWLAVNPFDLSVDDGVLTNSVSETSSSAE